MDKSQRKFTVSIIIPCYNSEQFLDRTLGSVANQTFQNYECIIVNDGSTDNSKEVFNNFVSQLSSEIASKFSMHDFENAGVGEARRRGVQMAQGDYFCFLDSDDTLNAQLVEKITTAMQGRENDNISLIRYGSIMYKPDCGWRPMEWRTPKDLMSGTEYIDYHVYGEGTNQKFFWILPILFAYKTGEYRDTFRQPDLLTEDAANGPVVVAQAENILSLNGFNGYEYHRRDGSRFSASENETIKALLDSHIYAYNEIKDMNIDETKKAMMLGHLGRLIEKVRRKYRELTSTDRPNLERQDNNLQQCDKIN